MIDYSIIIPSKNLPDLLQRALDSIPRRDGIQVIVVDDASDPGVVDFSAYPGLDDPHVEVVFTKEARGAGYPVDHNVWLCLVQEARDSVKAFLACKACMAIEFRRQRVKVFF